MRVWSAAPQDVRPTALTRNISVSGALGSLLHEASCDVQCLFSSADIMEPEDEAEPSAGRQLQVRCSQLLACGQWYHLAVVVSKEMKRNCTVTMYLDGQAIGSAKVNVRAEMLP